jgi:threonine aldolase
MTVGEAILFFDRTLAEDFDYRCKQAGQLASKMRFLAAPWVGMIESRAWPPLPSGQHPLVVCGTR